MNATTKMASVAVSAVLAVGLMGMTQASGEHSRTEHEPGILGSSGQGIVEKAKGALPRLTGKVDADRNLTISSDPVPSGRYRLIIRDTTSAHNWHITGQGVDRATGVNETGRVAWTVRLRDGDYVVKCDRHPTTMRFTLNVT